MRLKLSPKQYFRAFLRSLGIPESEWDNKALDLENTSARVSKMFRRELLAGYIDNAEGKLVESFTCFPSDGNDAMVFIGPIDYSSTCAHHLLPFMGSAYVAYVPDKLVVGASKIPRAVEHFARMLQIQERLTRQVADFIVEHAEPRAVVVLLDGAHQCMRCRGVRQNNTKMVTTAVFPASTSEAAEGMLADFYEQLRHVKGTR